MPHVSRGIPDWFIETHRQRARDIQVQPAINEMTHKSPSD